MEVRIVDDFNNPLMERREVTAYISFQGPTPKKDEVLEAVAKALKVKSTHVEVEKIVQLFGKMEAKVYVYVYDKPVREEKKVEEKEETGEEGESASDNDGNEASADSGGEQQESNE